MPFTAHVSFSGRLIDSYSISYQVLRRYATLHRSNYRRGSSGSLARLFKWVTALLLDQPSSFEPRQVRSNAVRHSSDTSQTRTAVIDHRSGYPSRKGITLDSVLTFKYHVSGVARACNYYLRVLRYIRKSMPFDVAKTFAYSIVGSRLD